MEVIVSVRELVGMVMRSGDIDNRLNGARRMQEGQEVHRDVQAAYPEGWEKEVTLKLALPSLGLTVQGRADGVFHRAGIHEIKSTRRNLLEWTEEGEREHWAQAQCYAHMLAVTENLEEVSIKLSYVNANTKVQVHFEKSFTATFLSEFFTELTEKYMVWHRLKLSWYEKRQMSLKTLGFPYGQYRAGQRKLAAAVYSAARDGFHMIAEAPTGVGKTASTLFPALKALGEDQVDRIFYLTAKTVARTVAEEASKHMREAGAALKTVTITAKDKICLTEEKKCNPVDCPYAKGHYDRINDALLDALNHEDHMDREAVTAFALKHKVCPAEFALDISLFSDVIIGDYNYSFDPLSRLQRFFIEVTERYIFLVDEAHNLPQRAREMYSAQLFRQDMLSLKKAFPRKSEAYKALGKLNTQMLEKERALKAEEEAFSYQALIDGKLLATISKAFEACSLHQIDNEGFELSNEDTEKLLSCYRFVFLSEYYGEGHFFLNTLEGCQMRCMEPSYNLAQMYEAAKAVILFSATMAPYDYYEAVLGVKGVKKLVLDSPFSVDHRRMLLGAGVDTRKNGREKSFSTIMGHIKALIKGRSANYLIFCPSYDYMRQIHEGLLELMEKEHLEGFVIAQSQDMTEADKLDFLGHFEAASNQSIIGLAVLGGSFSEGIDLSGSRLEGVVLVGFGTPYMSWENELLKTYYDSHSHNGYEYAYVYPAINKIVQAVGRLIRTETDKGVVLFLEDRYLHPRYKQLLPRHWKIEKFKAPEDIYEAHLQFWANQGEGHL